MYVPTGTSNPVYDCAISQVEVETICMYSLASPLFYLFSATYTTYPVLQFTIAKKHGILLSYLNTFQQHLKLPFQLYIVTDSLYTAKRLSMYFKVYTTPHQKQNIV